MSKVKVTPVSDQICQELGPVTSAVFGCVYCYCRGKNRVCNASQETMARALKISRACVSKHIKRLVTAGYLIQEKHEGEVSTLRDARRIVFKILSEDFTFTPTPQPKREKTTLEIRRDKFKSKVKRIKKMLIERDGEKCKHCGSVVTISIDHIIPLNWGGVDDLDNLQLLCRSCNSKKRDRLP